MTADVRADDGSLSVFAAVIAFAAIVAAGLVLDGGRLLAARRQASDLAGNAARAGAQALDERELRDGQVVVDPVGGATAVSQYLAETPATGRTAIAGETVTVTVRVPVRMTLLQVAGVGDMTITATRQARAARGITSGGSP